MTQVNVGHIHFRQLFDRLRLGIGYCLEGFRTITSYCLEPLSNVRRCRLAMPLGAGFLRWVLACRTIKRKKKSSLHPTPRTAAPPPTVQD